MSTRPVWVLRDTTWEGPDLHSTRLTSVPWVQPREGCCAVLTWPVTWEACASVVLWKVRNDLCVG